MVEPRVDPIPNEPAATIDLGDELALGIADYHAGIEAGLRYERGVELDDNAAVRLDRLLSLLESADVDRLIVLGDLGHRIGEPTGPEREELDAFFDAVLDRVPITLVLGNHDGGLKSVYQDRTGLSITDATGDRIGDIGLFHGHTWPDRSVLAAPVICMGHEHPFVRLQDTVGGSRVEKAWLRGRVDRETVAQEIAADADVASIFDDFERPELVVFPAFNDRSGGTWINVRSEGFLSPILPDALCDGQAYLLDGTRLGAYRSF
ncbi:MAG: metallophosphoesterase [Halobacteriota archaeon]